MTDQARREEEIREQLRACAQHSWDATNDAGKLKHRRHFEAIGIKSADELCKALHQVARDKETRSFDRAPNPKLKQTEPSMILQGKIHDQQCQQRKALQITIVLNPDRDEQGKLYGGTVFINDPKRRTDISRLLRIEHERGHNPSLLLRGPDLTKTAEQVLKSPISRLRSRPRLQLGGQDRENER